MLGVPVTSSVDALGNWVISINGGTPIPLTFSLSEVVITSTGKVVSTIGNEMYGGTSWGSSEVQNLFATNGGNGSGVASPPPLASATQYKSVSFCS